MAGLFNHVRPGDLITADFMNHFIDRLDSIDQRLTALEASGTPGDAVTVTGISGSLRIGGELTVEGKNFEVPARFNTVTIGGILVQSFNPGTDDSNLVFNIPSLPGVPKEVALVVSNRHGTASWNLIVLPRERPRPDGELLITERLEGLGIVDEGEQYTFPFELDSQTNIAETYRLFTIFTNAVGIGLDDWETNSELVNEDGTPIIQIRIIPGSPVLVGVRIRIPEDAESVNLTLRVESINNPDEPRLNRFSSPILIEVGSEQEASDPRVSFGPLEVVGAGRMVTDMELGDVIETSFGGGETFVRVTAEFEIVGDYAYSTSISPEELEIWSVNVRVPDPPTSSENAGSEQNIVIGLELNEDTDSESFRNLEIRVSRTNTDEIGTFDSWVRIPTRGY